MACRFVGLRPEEMNFAKPEKVLEAVRPDIAPDVEPETASDVTPDVTPEEKTSRKPRAEAKHK